MLERGAVLRWWKTADTDPALIPGGFSEERAPSWLAMTVPRDSHGCSVGVLGQVVYEWEAVFVNSAERKYEYSYLKNRASACSACESLRVRASSVRKGLCEDRCGGG